MITNNTGTMASHKILLVEDDQNFGDVLRSYLEMHDYDVTLAQDGEAGFNNYKQNEYDLCKPASPSCARVTS